MDQPFITLLAGGMQAKSSETSPSSGSFSENSYDTTLKSSISLVTHDTSRTKYHINELGTFAARLENAANKIFPNKGRSRYEGVYVLLLRWEEDSMGVECELEDLAKTFRSAYGFHTDTWLIPMFKSHFALNRKATQFVEDFGDSDNLLIVYYAGHGLMNGSRQHVWTCHSENHTSVKWYAIQTLFEEADSDVLLLLDCCAAASGAPADGESPSVTETIAACGFETWAPFPGRHSFTNTLISVLDDWKWHAAFTAAQLHCEILRQLRHEKPEKYRNTDKFEYRKSPIHVVSTNDPHARSIELCPRRNAPHTPNNKVSASIANARGASFSKYLPDVEGQNNDPYLAASIPDAKCFIHQSCDPCDMDSLTKILDNGDTALPHVLIKVALEEEPDSTLNFDQWKRWLQQFPGLATSVKIQGIYKSNSTLIIFSVPVVLWDWIPEDPACEFIGYVYSDNILSYATPASKVVSPCIPSEKLLQGQSNKSVPEPGILQSSTESPPPPHPASTSSPPYQTAKIDNHRNSFPRAPKSWCPEFSTTRNFYNERTRDNSKKHVEEDIDDLGFIGSVGTGSPLEVKVIKDFCRGISLEDVKEGRHTAGCRRAVWLEERTSVPYIKEDENARKHENPLTATGLYQALKQPRFGHDELPDAERRLIYITDLDPEYILALAATASYNEAQVLRNAIYQHLGLKTSVAVKIHSAEVTNFQLDFHLPYFVLRKSKFAPPKRSRGEANKQSRRDWIDLSFLKSGNHDLQIQEEPLESWIYQARISCVVTGFDEWTWTGYSFVDTYFNSDTDEVSDKQLLQDQISTGDFVAGMPSCGPRDYFIKVIEIRCRYVSSEWDSLIQYIELGICGFINEHLPALTYHYGRVGPPLIECFDWTEQALKLLNRLGTLLSDSMNAWKLFTSSDGDIGFFDGISPGARQSLIATCLIFKQLELMEAKLFLLKGRCMSFHYSLELRESLEMDEKLRVARNFPNFSLWVLLPCFIIYIFDFKVPEWTFWNVCLAILILVPLISAISLIYICTSMHWDIWRKVASWIKKEELHDLGD